MIQVIKKQNPFLLPFMQYNFSHSQHFYKVWIKVNTNQHEPQEIIQTDQ